jgi:DNA-binding MarR family transcriptional regulator
MNVGSLAAGVGMHPSTTPRLIAPLTRRRLVRTRTGTDRRERVVAITRKGQMSLVRAFPQWAGVQRRILSQLGDREWSSTRATLNLVRKSLLPSGALVKPGAR